MIEVKKNRNKLYFMQFLRSEKMINSKQIHGKGD